MVLSAKTPKVDVDTVRGVIIHQLELGFTQRRSSNCNGNAFIQLLARAVSVTNEALDAKGRCDMKLERFIPGADIL